MSEPQDDTGQVRRHRQVDPESELSTLAGSLTLEQLRLSIALLAPSKKIALGAHSQAIDALLQTGRSVHEIVSILRQTEAESTAKHCLVAFSPTGLPTFVRSIAIPIKFDSDGITFTVTFSKHSDSLSIVTFEHEVTVRDWVETGPSTKSLHSFSVRHPIVMRFLPRIGAALFLFPGFSQGDAIKRAQRLPYEQVLTALVQGIKKLDPSVVFRALPIERSISILSEGANARIEVTRSNVEGDWGSIGVAARQVAHARSSVETTFTKFVGPHLSEVGNERLQAAFLKAFRDATASNLVVHWIQEEVFTRINFWGVGAELLFVWHGSTQSMRSIDSIVSLLFDVALNIAIDNKSEAWDYLAKLEPNSVVLPSNYVGRFGLDRDLANNLFVKATKAGLLEPVYRVKTAMLLHERQNEWVSDPSILRNKFTTEANQVIDGCDPSNIEVGFIRLAKRSGR